MKPLFFCLIAIVSCCICACNSDNRTGGSEDCFAGLTNDEKKLIQDIISQMKTEKKDSFFGGNSSTYAYFNIMEKARADELRPIEQDVARELSANYDSKRNAIERLRQGSLRGGTDTRYVWTSVDDFAPYFGQLLDFQYKNKTKVGLKIVFGSYKWETKDTTGLAAGRRIYGDSLSGRNTVYFLGTYDTIPGGSGDFVTRHKDIWNLSSPIPIVTYSRGSIMNHGTLCPDSCTTP